MKPLGAIAPAWPAPPRVRALFTTRQGGVSTGRWDDAGAGGGLNLGANCGDEPANVASNRERVGRDVGVPIRWLAQVHGARVVEVDASDHASSKDSEESDTAAGPEQADAQVTGSAGLALGVLVADCLPVLLADRAGSIVGVAHAGWRGLAGGVLENTVELMRVRCPGANLLAWLGPCIGPTAFEVGEDVLEAFVSQDPQAAAHFRPAARAGKWWADLPGLAADRLERSGVGSVTRSQACTVSDPERFWSYRRDGVCGRMAGIIWLQD